MPIVDKIFTLSLQSRCPNVQRSLASFTIQWKEAIVIMKGHDPCSDFSDSEADGECCGGSEHNFQG